MPLPSLECLVWVGTLFGCSQGDGASLVQATAAMPKITKTTRMTILIFFLQCCENFQSSLSTGSAATGADGDELPGRMPGLTSKPQFPSPIQSLPFRLRWRVRTRGWPAECQRLRAMPQRWVLACVAEIPEVVHQLHPYPGLGSSSRIHPCARLRLQLARRLALTRLNCWGCPEAPGPRSSGPWRGPGLIRRLIPGSPRRSGHAQMRPSRRRSRRSSPRRCGDPRR